MNKAPFSNAPNFSLPTINGIFQLRDLEGLNRVALFFSGDERQAREAIKQRENDLAAWHERELVLVLIVPSKDGMLQLQNLSRGTFIVRDERGEVAAQYGVSPGETRFFLLGKSRFPVALCVDCLPDDAEIFALIDAMPMRQREIRERNPGE